MNYALTDRDDDEEVPKMDLSNSFSFEQQQQRGDSNALTKNKEGLCDDLLARILHSK
jgi:hypothetical protein